MKNYQNLRTNYFSSYYEYQLLKASVSASKVFKFEQHDSYNKILYFHYQVVK